MTERVCFRLLPAQVILAVVMAINGLIASLFASNFIGPHAMTVIGLYNPARIFIIAVGIMLVTSSQLLIGKYIGKNDSDKINGVFSANIILSVIISIIVVLFFAICIATDVTLLYSGSKTVQVHFDMFLVGTAFGVLPQILGHQFAGFLSIENQGKYTAAASILCIVTTLAMNYLFVCVFDFGLFGLALASTSGMWVFFVVQFIYYIKSKSEFRFTRKGFSLKLFSRIFSTGLYSALAEVYAAVCTIIVNAVIIGYAGADGLSAFATGTAFLETFWALPLGMCAVSRMMLSISAGEEDRKTLSDVIRVMFSRYVPILFCAAALISAFAFPAATLYYQDTSSPVFDMTVLGLRLLPFYMPLAVICEHFVCCGHVLKNKNAFTHFLIAADGVLLVSLFTFILVPVLGIAGAYISGIATGIATTLIIIFYAWIKNKKFPKTIEKLIVLPENFGVGASDRIDISVKSLAGVVTISEKIHKFCLSKGIDKRRSYFAALAVEEMAGNVVRHGFSGGKKSHSMDIRVVCKGDELILRIKDDCRPFDPRMYKEIKNPEDPVSNFGIRIVFSLCSDIKYRNILGMNALTIHL